MHKKLFLSLIALVVGGMSVTFGASMDPLPSTSTPTVSDVSMDPLPAMLEELNALKQQIKDKNAECRAAVADLNKQYGEKNRAVSALKRERAQQLRLQKTTR